MYASIALCLIVSFVKHFSSLTSVLVGTPQGTLDLCIHTLGCGRDCFIQNGRHCRHTYTMLIRFLLLLTLI